MRFPILAHEAGIGADEIVMFAAVGLFLLVTVGVWLASRRFKPVIDNDLPDDEDQDSGRPS